MKAVIFAAEYDTGGQGIRLKRAFDRYQPDWEVRAVHSQTGYFDYDYDLERWQDEKTVQQVMAEADVIHVRNFFGGLGHFKLRDDVALVVHYHGTMFREHPQYHLQEAAKRGAKQIASTLDLCRVSPEIEWLPSPFDLEELSAIRAEADKIKEPSRSIRIAHAPTNRNVKSTAAVMQAILDMNERGVPAVLDLIEHRPYKTCLQKKALADIYVDQLILGQGNNALECYGMRVPVVAGVEDRKVREYMIDRWGSLPFVEATSSTLTDQLISLATEPNLRTHWAERGHDYLSRYHDEQAVVASLAHIYRSAIEARAV